MSDKRDGLVAEEFDDAMAFEAPSDEEVIEDTIIDGGDDVNEAVS